MLGALADGEHARMGGDHRVVDEDAALRAQAGRDREVGPRDDPDRDDDEVARQPLAVLEHQALDAALAEHRLGPALQHDLDAELLDARRQQCRRALVELALHQAVHQVHDRHRAAARREPVCGLEPEQPAADHGGARGAVRGGKDRVAVLGAAERMYALEVAAGERRHQRVAARREHAADEAERLAVVERAGPGVGVEGDHLPAEADVDIAIGVPVGRPQLQRVGVDIPRQQRRELDAVVREPRLAADER